MNKQQLASKIWESANKMRSKIEANEYKDYILGFIFYKFLSDKEVAFLKKDGYEEEDLMAEVHENNESVVTYCQQDLGYFIAYDNLFSTWLAKGNSFTVDNVRVALSAFNRLISDTHKKVFNKIFNTLETGLSKLGDSASSQTKSIRDLIQLIKDIPMDGKQDYDVLGFIYEYLISNFAANAGKKAGEFYTPHEVSQLMSEIVANHLQNRDKIKIYDPTSGSGSLLITIGKSAAKYMENESNIMYYAQELKENTYNLTRMNLVMRGIKPNNIFTRCGDTLEEDWPWFDDADPAETYDPLYVDAVVSNPPYSQHWDPSHKETDPRYRYGMAPKGKADYAFLLHDLYHVKPDGIMTIVLPHGVLFRGDAVGGPDGQGEGEGRIRRNLIENNNIEAIIGLPSNIFFGTGIPTIIMVLRQKREESDVLFIDASKGFTKVGKTNKLMASDIKKIVDSVAGKKTIEKYSRLVSKQEIRENGYNLNLPRYVDSSDAAETWDIYATMFGGIPNSEIELLKDYWLAFPNLRTALFTNDGTPYSALAVEDIKQAIGDNEDVKAFIAAYQAAFADFGSYLDSELIGKMMDLSISQEESVLAENIFARLAGIPLVDKYQAYQLLDDHWGQIATDLEIIQTEGFAATKQVDPNMVIKKKNGEDEEVQEGWVGHIIPFELVQKTLLREEYDALMALKDRLAAIGMEISEIIDSIPEEDRGDYLNDDNTAFVAKEFAAKLRDIYSDIVTPELTALQGYVDLLDAKAGKATKLHYIQQHPEVRWSLIDGNIPYAKGKVVTFMKALQMAYVFPEDSLEEKLIKVNALIDEEKETKRLFKEKSAELHQHTKETIESLSDEQAIELIRLKWIDPVNEALHAVTSNIIELFSVLVAKLADKYAITYLEIGHQIEQSKSSLSGMLNELVGNEFDMKGLEEFISVLGGE